MVTEHLCLAVRRLRWRWRFVGEAGLIGGYRIDILHAVVGYLVGPLLAVPPAVLVAARGVRIPGRNAHAGESS